ncbi:hypothetical protein TNCV_3563981 [Trichonephila clavipes]|nr:hypothetical protein TNCV_3563981 [Trichonephila clavipes]
MRDLCLCGGIEENLCLHSKSSYEPCTFAHKMMREKNALFASTASVIFLHFRSLGAVIFQQDNARPLGAWIYLVTEGVRLLLIFHPMKTFGHRLLNNSHPPFLSVWWTYGGSYGWSVWLRLEAE